MLTRISRGPSLIASGVVAGVVACAALLTGADKVVPAGPRAATAASETKARGAYGALPLAFEANGGRTDKRVKFLARGSGYSIFLTPTSSVLSLSRGKAKAPAVLRTTLAGAASNPSVEAESKLPGVVNVYKGDDPAKWRTGIPTYRRVRYHEVYPGIDLVYYGRQRQLEYDFVLAPRADPAAIALEFAGKKDMRIAANGDLLIRVPGGTIRHLRPIAYQRVGSERLRVAARWDIDGSRASFRLGDYDRSRELVIDPILTYSSFLGGSGLDTPEAIDVAPDGTAVVVGQTVSNNFPGATPRGSRTDTDAFVTRLNANGSAMVHSTYLGGDGTDSDSGNPDSDVAYDVQATSAYAYVVGYTYSTDYPVTLDTRLDVCSDGGSDAFFTRLTSSGALNYGTCLGGSGTDTGRSIVVDTAGTGFFASTHVYVAGTTASTSSTFPETSNAFDTELTTADDGFLTRIAFPSTFCTSCSITNAYTTYIGGSGDDNAFGVAVDTSADETWVTGYSNSNDFPVTTGTDPDASGYDAFVVRFNTFQSGASSRVASALFGGASSDYAYAIDVTSDNVPWFVGKTYSFDDPGTSPTNEGIPGASTSSSSNLRHDPASTQPDGFIATMSSTGTSPSSNYVGGTQSDELFDVDVREITRNSTTYVSQYAIGNTSSGPTDPYFVPRNQVQGQECAAQKPRALVIKRYSSASPGPAMMITCLGGTAEAGDSGTGIAADASGKAYVTGVTNGGFPQVGAFQSGGFGGGTTDGYAARLEQRPPTIDSGPSGVIDTNDVAFTFSIASGEDGLSYDCSTPSPDRLVAGTRTGCPSGSANYPNLAEGQHTFEAVTVDDTYAESSPATRTFTVDTLAPAAFDLIGPDNGATTTPQPTFTWQEAADAGTPVTYEIQVDGQKLQDVSAGACSGGTCSAQAATPIPTGTHEWHVVARDGASPPHPTASSSKRSITVIDPPVARLTVAPNPALVGRPVTFDASASADAAHQIQRHLWDLDGDGTFELETPDPVTTRSYDAAGVINVGLKVVDSTGTESAPTTVALRVNDLGTGNQVGVSINEGAQYTNKPDVELTVNFPPATTSLLVANDGGFMKALNLKPERVVKWRLDSSGPERLPKTVYLRFLVGTFASPNYTDDIILDERPPVVDQAALVNPPAAASAVAAALRTYKVRVKARDSNSGVRGVQITANKRKPGKLIRYTAKARGRLKTVRVKSAKRPRFIRARDLAGNYSRWKKLR